MKLGLILLALFFVGLQALVWTGSVSVDWQGVIGKLNALIFIVETLLTLALFVFLLRLLLQWSRADFRNPVAQAVVRAGWIDLVGIGRMVLSYPEMPAETLQRGTTERKKICRTFSDCTTAPRNALASGCYPLDPFYKQRPEAEVLKRLKQEIKG